MSMMKKAVLGLALGATALTAAAPAEAQRWRGYRGGGWHHRGGDATGAAILGGIVGLGVGAAIASNNNRDRYYDGYYDRGYYPPPPPYRGGYYARDYYYDRYPACYTQRRYDPYYGRSVRVQVCD